MSYTSKLILAGCAALLCARALAQAPPTAVKQVALKTEAAAVRKVDAPVIEKDGDAQSRSTSSGYLRRADERVYEAAIISVRAVMGRPEHRCWVEGASTESTVDAEVKIIGRDAESSQLISRCQSVQSGSPSYWDVTYLFRNVEHTVQMSAAPGQVIYVNKRGEPRL